MENERKKIGYRLISVMDEQGSDKDKPTKKLAEILGLGESAASKILNGKQALSLKQLKVCMDVFQKSAGYLL